jgi:hypothetical protein
MKAISFLKSAPSGNSAQQSLSSEAVFRIEPRWLQSAAIFRHPGSDGLFVGLALIEGALLLIAPSLLLIALGIWWGSNTIAHNFIHLPFFKRPLYNKVFSAYLTVLLGIPQRLWRDRHLAHHAEVKWQLRFSRQLGIEVSLVFALWSCLFVTAPHFFSSVYLPGYLIGLALCHLQGYYEHARGATSHYGRVYNRLFFNDGYHVEHHNCPNIHWKQLPQTRLPNNTSSRWPAVLRWLELRPVLHLLERLVLKSRRLQQLVLRQHECAFRLLVPSLPRVRSIVIVGGGIFPRTTLILRDFFPDAEITVIDASAENIQTAKRFLQSFDTSSMSRTHPTRREGDISCTPKLKRNSNVKFVHRLYVPSDNVEADVLVIPLSYLGDRSVIYNRPPAAAVFVHDWMWRRSPNSALISPLLLKRLNLVLSE